MDRTCPIITAINKFYEKEWWWQAVIMCLAILVAAVIIVTAFRLFEILIGLSGMSTGVIVTLVMIACVFSFSWVASKIE